MVEHSDNAGLYRVCQLRTLYEAALETALAALLPLPASLHRSDEQLWCRQPAQHYVYLQLREIISHSCRAHAQDLPYDLLVLWQAVETAAQDQPGVAADAQLEGILKLAARHGLDTWTLKTRFIVSQLTVSQDLPADHLQSSTSPSHLAQRSSDALAALCHTYHRIPPTSNGSLAAWSQLAAACSPPEAGAALQACAGFALSCKQHAPGLAARAVVEPVLRAAIKLPEDQHPPPAAAEVLAQHVTPANLQQLQQALDALQTAAAELSSGSGQCPQLPQSQLLAMIVAARLLTVRNADQAAVQQQLPGILQKLQADNLEQMARWAVLGGPQPVLPGLQGSAALPGSLAVQLAHAQVHAVHVQTALAYCGAHEV